MPVRLSEGPKEIWWTEHLSVGLGKEASYWWIAHSANGDFLLSVDLLHERQRQDKYGHHPTMGNPECFVLKITMLIGTTFKRREPWNSPFEWMFRQV